MLCEQHPYFYAAQNSGFRVTLALQRQEYGRLAVWAHSPLFSGLGAASTAAGRCISAGVPPRPLTPDSFSFFFKAFVFHAFPAFVRTPSSIFTKTPKSVFSLLVFASHSIVAPRLDGPLPSNPVGAPGKKCDAANAKRRAGRNPNCHVAHPPQGDSRRQSTAVVGGATTV